MKLNTYSIHIMQYMLLYPHIQYLYIGLINKFDWVSIRAYGKTQTKHGQSNIFMPSNTILSKKVNWVA